MIFEHSEKTRDLIGQVSRFMEDEIIPNAPLFNQQAAEGVQAHSCSGNPEGQGSQPGVMEPFYAATQRPFARRREFRR